MSDTDKEMFDAAKTAVQRSAAAGAIADLAEQMQVAASHIHNWNVVQGFWQSENTGEKLMLMVTELGEAMEADRKSLMCDKAGMEAFTGVEEELADTIIRILDFAGHHNLRLGDAFLEKLAFNLTRPYMHGKKN